MSYTIYVAYMTVYHSQTRTNTSGWRCLGFVYGKDDMCPLNDVNSIRKCLMRRVGVPIASGKWINNNTL